MILFIDNYDSFTYNLVDYVGRTGAEVLVRRNDRISLAEVGELQPEGIVISPGPGRPEQAGICLDLIRHAGARVPILGVCLGHQCIGLAYGASVIRGPEPVHGKTSLIHHNGRGIFGGIPSPFPAARYHSLVVDRPTLPAQLEMTAWTADGLVMAVRHKIHPVQGVQFHPESIATDAGLRIIENWLADVAAFWHPEQKAVSAQENADH